MDLELLPGEGVNAFTADVQDATGKSYPLRVEFMGQVPDFPDITMFIVRLADDLADVGDVLLRLNLHGLGSNRERMAIGQVGGGPADDAGAIATPAHNAPEAGLNFDGYNFWLGKLNEFNGNFVNAEMVKAFIVSGEYRQRFGP
jgi:hypothetical protein